MSKLFIRVDRTDGIRPHAEARPERRTNPSRASGRGHAPSRELDYGLVATHLSSLINAGLWPDQGVVIMNKVEENPIARRFQLAIDGSADIAAAYYRVRNSHLVLTHTIVPQGHEGKGIGSGLARGVFDSLRETGRTAVLQCPFMAAFYERHPDYADVVDAEDELGLET